MSIEWQIPLDFWPSGMRVGIERGFFGRRDATVLDDPRTGYRWRKADGPEAGDDRGRWHKVAPLGALPREAAPS